MAFNAHGPRKDMKRREELSPEEQAMLEISRIKLPKEPQVFGIVLRRVGGSRMIVKCLDGKERNCKIPGRMKRFLWVRENDIVIVEPWELTPETKGDVVFKYTKTQVAHLKRREILKDLDSIVEF